MANPQENEDYYSILGVPPDASEQTIRKAYLKQSLRYHPDKNLDNPEAAKAQFVRIGRAYQILSDRSQRVAYDRSRRTGTHYSNYSTPYNDTDYDEYRTSNASSYQQHNYDSYRAAFDATMAGLSDDELRDLMGAVAIVGGIVGSILGSRLATGSSSGWRGAAALVTSQVVSHAATTLVATAHEQATERVSRGGNDSNISAEDAWKELIGAVGRKAMDALFSPPERR